ncbi:ABC transporter ATP-binding protein, partial [Acinetobacter baumannii]
QDVTITVETGKTLVILGPNGSGESTILKTIARQIAPLKGTVSLNSSDIWTLPAAAFAQLVAYVPQNNDPEIQLTVEEYVSLGRSPHQKWWQW